MIEKTCTYKDERYSVHENGEVLRHHRAGKKPRPTDNQWTFGKPNKKTGYMEIATVVVHRIVATAFHGVAPKKEHVVDHIDTNRRNNRPENLRWVTRLENILLNPITAKRIASVCGSVEAFLEDPSRFSEKFPDTNYKWMFTVSALEARISLKRLLAWAKSDKLPSGGSLGEWIYNRSLPNEFEEEVLELTTSLTPNAVQKNWKTPCEFPYCPQTVADNPIIIYAKNIKIGKAFSQNPYFNSIVSDLAISKDENTLWVMCKNSDDEAIKPWTLAQVTYENDLFVHESLGSFFGKDGAEKYFTLAQGLEWTGGDTHDDFV